LIANFASDLTSAQRTKHCSIAVAGFLGWMPLHLVRWQY